MVRIITDSVASIPADEAREAGIEVVTLYVNRGREELADAEMDLDAFYADIYGMVDDIPTSSQPSQHALESVFEDAARAGDEVLGVFISSGLSGTFDGAVRAARAVKARNIDFSYAIVDSSSCGYDEAWPVFDGVEARDAGEGLSGCLSAVLEGMERTRFLFAPETLTFLQKGGRIGGAAALLGNLIQLAPVLTVVDGTAATLAKVRTRKKALERIASSFRADIEKFGLKRVVVHYIGDKAPALAWAREVVEPLIGRRVRVLPVSPVIGLHVGPAVGIAYECASAVAGKLTVPARSRVCAS
ncbi:fatty acid-binding protein DegV [Gordonibacter sp. An230]|uniref:DegV family protein n=1 Tax=Gordonibacter sp. An230 TaxID=1965592 RepID=UPI000B3794DF|nr:DegV family protein [Gordonibacter sp. An230]OUO88029.1 fatty acid-binding protein DegV [Gordonibacter sp. An230]